MSHYCLNCFIISALFLNNPSTLVIDHQSFNFLMELNWFITKLIRWTLILHEYDFDIVHKASGVNWDDDDLNQNPIVNKKHTIKAHWHGVANLKVVLK
jgi:hypothetical protein